MFERFTERARRVVVLAREEARMLNQNYIGTEHLLLGLILEGEGVAARALASASLESMGVYVPCPSAFTRAYHADTSGNSLSRPSAMADSGPLRNQTFMWQCASMTEGVSPPRKGLPLARLSLIMAACARHWSRNIGLAAFIIV